jgi:outer membrane protein TolC
MKYLLLRTGRYWLIVCLLCGGGGAFAGESQPFPSPPSEKIYRLSLGEVTQLALDNNLDIQIAEYDARIARTDEGVAESLYDTMFNAEIEYHNDKSKQTSTLAGDKTLDNDYNIGLSKKSATGTTVDVDLFNNRHRTNSTFSTSPLTHESTLGLTVTQELGRNFFGIQDRGDVKIARLSIENSGYTSWEKIEGVLADAQKAYWDLVMESEKVRIAEDMVAQAKRLYDLNQEKLKNGLVAATEAIAAHAHYEARKNDLILARHQFEIRVNALKLLLNVTDDDIRIEPSEDFSFLPYDRPLIPSLQQAFSSRRDYKKTLNTIQAKDLNLSMKKNSLWPQIDLTATLERNGIGDHFKQAVRQITEEDHPDFFAGLEVTLPLENTGARARLKAAELEKAKAIINLKLLERRIAVEITDQVRSCRIFREAALNEERIAQLQQQKFQEEEKKFRYGRSDTDTLIRFQEDWLDARGAAAAAKHRYHTAMVDLALKEGSLLDKYGKTVGFKESGLYK